MVLGFLLSLLIAPLPPPQTSQPMDLNLLLDRASENARRYTHEMRNLTADETRETEIYSRIGAVVKRRRTRASLVVHQAGANTLAEFRRVIEVDGKALKTQDDRLEALLKNLATAESTADELALVERESSKHDLAEMQMRGMSLNQAWPLEDPAFRQSATFRLDGTDKISGRETVVVRYEDLSRLPDEWRAQGIKDSFTPTRVFARGRIWIDVQTAEIWRYETETMVEEATLDKPEVWDRMEFYYVRSAFGIPTPQKIVWTSNTSVARSRGKLSLARKGKLTAEFGPFRRFGSDVKISPVTP